MTLSVDLSNILEQRVECGVSEEELDDVDGELRSNHDELREKDPGFLTVPEDVDVDAVEALADDLRNDFTSLVNVGIGGSALGGRTLVEALAPDADVYFVDNADPSLLADVVDEVELADTVFVVVSKSGSTAETVANYRVVRELLQHEGLDPRRHSVAVTGNPDAFDVSRVVEFPDVPGRYSALSVVGLLPAAFAGVDVEAVVEGARDGMTRCRKPSLHDNPGYALAAASYVLGERGFDVSVMMPYSERLEAFAEWYAQLYAESLGKERERGRYGLTPVRALGTTDQHSLLQLLVDGPRDKQVTFVDAPAREDFDVPGDDYLAGASLDGLREVELEATRTSLTESDVPNVRLSIDLVEEDVGELLYTYMVAVAAVAELAGVDAYGQPGVEHGKELARDMLESGGVHSEGTLFGL